MLQLWDSVSNGYWHARRLNFTMRGPFHTLEWLRAQPWQNHEIALFGPSYLGAAAWAAAHDSRISIGA